MIKTKNLLALGLAAVITFSLTACGDSPTSSTSETPSDVSSNTETPAASDAETSYIPTTTKPDYGTLSDDINSYQVEINGDLYQFPMSFDQFMAYGWEFTGDTDEIISSDIPEESSGYFDLDGVRCHVYIMNFDYTTGPQPVSSSTITGVILDTYYMDYEDDSAIITLPQGIVLNESTLDDATAAYGEPTTSEETKNVYYTYQTEGGEVKLGFDENKLLFLIEINNFVKP